MADSTIPYQNPVTINGLLDAESLVVGGTTVKRERVQVTGSADTEIAEVIAGAPGTSAMALATRSVSYGIRDNGEHQAIAVTGEGHQEVAIHNPTLPFGAVHTEKLTPIFQCDAVYGVNTTESRTTITLSGTVTAANNLHTCSTGTTSGAAATLQSRKRLRYRPGQGLVCRFTALWSAPVASSVVIAGVGTSESGLYFGYNGTSFGILHATGGVREIQTLTVTTASTATNDYVVTLGGVSFTATATNNSSLIKTAYEIAAGTYAGWTCMQRGATVVFLANSAGDKTGTFTLAQTGAATPAAGSYVETLAGIASTDTWIPQSSWNGDKLDGSGASGMTLDTTKGNVFQIGVQYLGFGPIVFQVKMTPSSGVDTSRFVIVHTLRSPNSRTTTTLSQPSFPFTMTAYSTGSTTNVSVSSGSHAGFIAGDHVLTGPRMSYFDTSTAVTTGAYYTLMTIRNDLVFQGRPNQAVVRLISIGGAHDDATPVAMHLIKNATLVGTPNFTAWSASSCTYTDTAATTCTITDNSQIVFTMPVGASGSGTFAFSDIITLQPGETITLAATTVVGTSTYTMMTLNTREDQ